jgi:hypothetical protein
MRTIKWKIWPNLWINKNYSPPLGLMAHVYNPSYMKLGGLQVQARPKKKSLWEFISTNDSVYAPIILAANGEAQKGELWSGPA